MNGLILGSISELTWPVSLGFSVRQSSLVYPAVLPEHGQSVKEVVCAFALSVSNSRTEGEKRIQGCRSYGGPGTTFTKREHREANHERG